MNLDPELLRLIMSQYQGVSGADAITGIQANPNIDPLTGMYKGNMSPTQDSPFAPQVQALSLPNPTIDPFGSPQSYKNATVDPGVAYQQNKDEQMNMQKSMYDKAMMEQYLNNQAFGAGSQLTGTMPYYADRMGRGIQSGNTGQAVVGGLALALQGFKGAMAGAGQQKTEDFLKSEGQKKMRDYMKSGRGVESLYGNFAMGNAGNFEEGGLFSKKMASNDLYGKTAQELYELQGKLRGIENQESMTDDEFDNFDYNNRLVYNFINENPYYKGEISKIQEKGLDWYNSNQNLNSKITGAQIEAIAEEEAINERNSMSSAPEKKMSFKEMFAHSRGKGDKIFEWNGRKYTTELAQEKNKSKGKTIRKYNDEDSPDIVYSGGKKVIYDGNKRRIDDEDSPDIVYSGGKKVIYDGNKRRIDDEGTFSKVDKYLKAAGRSGLKRFFGANFEEGGEMAMEQQMPMEQEVPKEQNPQMPQGEEILFAYFEANQFNEQQAQEFMQTFQQLAPEEQQAAIQEMAAALSPQQGERPEQVEQEKPTILDGKTMSESTQVVKRGGKEFLQIINETPISKKEANDFRKFL